MTSPSQVNIKQADIAVPIRHLGSVRPPSFFENFALSKIKHGQWRNIGGIPSFSGGIMTLFDASVAEEMRSVPEFVYGSMLIYAKLANTNSIVGFDGGSGNYVRVTNNQFQVANAEAGTINSVAVTVDETAYHNYLIIWNSFGCELWIDGALQATILDVIPHTDLPIRLYAPANGYLYVNSVQVYQDVPSAYDPFGKLFMPKDINRLIPSLKPTGKVIFQDPIDNSKGMDLKNWQRYFNGGTAAQIANDTDQNECFLGAQSIKITPAVTNWLGICKTLGFLPSKRFGIEAWLAIEGDTLRGDTCAPHDLIDYVRIFIDWYEATYFYAGAIQWVPTGQYIGKWQYAYGEAAGYQFKDWSGFTQKLMLTCFRDYVGDGWGEDFWYWLYLKMIVDFDARKYVAFQCNNQRLGVEQAEITDQVLKYTSSIEDKTLDFGIEYKLKATTRTPSLLIGAIIFTDEELG